MQTGVTSSGTSLVEPKNLIISDVWARQSASSCRKRLAVSINSPRRHSILSHCAPRHSYAHYHLSGILLCSTKHFLATTFLVFHVRTLPPPTTVLLNLHVIPFCLFLITLLTSPLFSINIIFFSSYSSPQVSISSTRFITYLLFLCSYPNQYFSSSSSSSSSSLSCMI